MVNIVADLQQRGTRSGWANRPAFYTDGRTWTHGQVHDLAARAATVLADHGVRPGGRVLIALPDGIGWVAAFLGTACLGATAVIVNPELTADGHAFVTRDSDVGFAVSTAALGSRFAGTRWLEIGDLLARTEQADGTAPCPVPADAPLYVQYTSGTTGVPKGVVHTHGDLPEYANAVGEAVLGIDQHDVGLSMSKLFFAYGFGNALVFPLYTGSAAVLLGDRQTPGTVREAVIRYGVTVLYAVPSTYVQLISGGDPAAFGSVRAAVSAGEHLRPDLAERISAFLRAPVFDQLGSTEVGHAFCANGVAFVVPGTIGRPVPGYRLEIRDATGNPVGDGIEGDLWVSGPTLMREYLNGPDATARTLVDGWLATQDRAVRDSSGAYRHVGRADDMEMVAGVTVAPLEVEAALAGHPAVREVAVVAATDTHGATALHAYVVAAPEDSPQATLPAELITLARSRLAAFKVPRVVHLVDALPRTPNGKLRRHLLRSGSW